MVPHGDLNVLDPGPPPTWPLPRRHDVRHLFGIDGNMNPQPQMVGKTDISGRSPRPHLRAAPGPEVARRHPVTARDCVASLVRRWACKGPTPVSTCSSAWPTRRWWTKTLPVVLKEPLGLHDRRALAKTSTPICCMTFSDDIAATDNTDHQTPIGTRPFWIHRGQPEKRLARGVMSATLTTCRRGGHLDGIAGGKRRDARPRSGTSCLTGRPPGQCEAGESTSSRCRRSRSLHAGRRPRVRSRCSTCSATLATAA